MQKQAFYEFLCLIFENLEWPDMWISSLFFYRPAYPDSHKNTDKTVEQPRSFSKDTSKVTRKVIHGKPVVIDVDTITRMVPTDEEIEKGHSRLF